MTDTYDTAELKRLLAEATEGPIQKMADDPLAVDFHSAVYVPKMTGATPVTRLRSNAALIVAAVNALPALLARIEELEGALTEIARCERYVAKADTNYELEMRRVELDRLIQSSAARLKGAS